VHGDARARARANVNPEMPQLRLSAFLEPQVPPLGMPHARCARINRIYYSKSAVTFIYHECKMRV